MILKSETKNYHSHKNTVIEFCEGVNIITGASDAGKSSSLRPMIWNITNRPTGDGMKNWDSEDDAEISNTITTPEGSVTKRRKQAKAFYELITKDGPTTFEAFKTDVPEEISNFFNFSEFNYQSQHSPYFLLNESGGVIATKLNDLVGLSIIDTMFKNLNSLATDSKKNGEKSSKTAKGLKEQIDQFAYLDKAAQELEAISLLVSEHEKRLTKLTELSSLINSLKKTQEEIASYRPLIRLEEEVISIIEDISIYEFKKNNLSSLSTLISNIKQCEETIIIGSEWCSIEHEAKLLLKSITEYSARKEKLESLIQLIASISVTAESITSEKAWLTVEPAQKEIWWLLADHSDRKETLGRLSKLITDYKLLDINSELEALSKLRKEKQSLLAESGVCPYCFSELDSNKIKMITQ